MLQKLKNKIIRHLPMSQGEYVDTFADLLDIIEVQKESEMFIRNDLWQLSRVVHKLENKTTTKKENKKDDNSMFG